MKDSPHAVGYLAPCRCKKCKPVMRHVSGVSAEDSSPNLPLGTLYHGERLPQLRNKLNLESFFPCRFFVLSFRGESSPGNDAGWMSSWLHCPVCNGYAGAVATMAASAPVGVPPAYPTFDGNKEGKALVGLLGGKWCTSVDPDHGGASTETSSCAWAADARWLLKQFVPQIANWARRHAQAPRMKAVDTWSVLNLVRVHCVLNRPSSLLPLAGACSASTSGLDVGRSASVSGVCES
jgi:hypothetical protein